MKWNQYVYACFTKSIAILFCLTLLVVSKISDAKSLVELLTTNNIISLGKYLFNENLEMTYGQKEKHIIILISPKVF